MAVSADWLEHCAALIEGYWLAVPMGRFVFRDTHRLGKSGLEDFI